MTSQAQEAAALTAVLRRLADLRARAEGSTSLADGADGPAAGESGGERSAALDELTGRLGLTDEELELLLAAASPRIDAATADALDPGRSEHGGSGDVRAWVALSRLGRPAIAAERLLHEDAALVRMGLLRVLADQRMAVAPAAVEFLLLLDPRPSTALVAATSPTGTVTGPPTRQLEQALRAGLRLCYLQDDPGGLASAYAAGAFEAVGLDSLHVDTAVERPAEVDDAAIREAVVRGHLSELGLVIGPVSDEVIHQTALAWAADSGVPLVLFGHAPWDPRALPSIPWQLRLPTATAAERIGLWTQVIDDDSVSAAQVERALGHLHVDPAGIHRSVLSARLQSHAEGRKLAIEDLVAAARSQSGAALQRLSKRITPGVRWDFLVVPPSVTAALDNLCARARQRDHVLGELAVGGSSSRKRGTVAMFGGPPGTGKSLAAEVVAAELGLDVYQVNLATVIDKYVGETEKNLERIFVAAAGVNCLLFFDEADALFGKRSEVKDAQDKYANVEVAYLLQRLEDFDGVAVLASNLRGNLDDAFKRRIDVIVDFPAPDRPSRVRLWRACLGAAVELGPDADLEACGAFELAGGDIRNAAVSAVIAASEDGTPVGMRHLVRAAYDEYRKIGRFAVDAAEFAPYADLLA